MTTPERPAGDEPGRRVPSNRRSVPPSARRSVPASARRTQPPTRRVSTQVPPPRANGSHVAGSHVAGSPAVASSTVKSANGTPSGGSPTSGSRPRPSAAKGRPTPAAPRRTALPSRPIGSVRLANPGTRLRASLFGIAFLLSLFAGRLLQLQGVDASQYAVMADTERRTDVSLTASRGTITDRDGVPLAVSVDRVNVFADQTLVKGPALTARMLAPYTGVDVGELEADLQGTSRFKYLAKDLDQETWAKIDALDLPGIYDEVVSERSYPGDTLAANVVGFVDAEGTGQAGVEKMYDAELQGTDGETSYLRDGSGRQIPSGASSETAPVPGENVRLTIDQDLQWYAQNEIAAKVQESGAVSGSVVIMTRDQKILAMATAPTFNPNDVGSTDPALLGNRVVEEAYEPGSIEKALTAAAIIEEGLATPASVYEVPDRIVIDGEDYNDHSPHPTGMWTLANIIAESSNVGTLTAANPMPAQTLYDYLRKFGLGSTTGIGFPGETAGIVHDPADWYESTRHTIAFGQGLSATALQMASVYATIANGGVRVAPSLVEGFETPDGFQPVPAPEQSRVVSENTASLVSQMLEMVVNEGTAPMAAIDGYKVAGKTGTAQFSDPECGCYRGYTASFAGFAPADDPQLIVSVTLQRPVNGYYGGQLGGPVFKNVMTYGLQKLEIPPTGAPLAALPLFGPTDPAYTKP